MKIIALSNDGCSRSDVDMGDAGVYTFISRFNYSAPCWVLDIQDALGEDVLTGLMLVPDIDFLVPYPDVAEKLGSLSLSEATPGDYLSPDSLGNTTQLIWIPADEMP